MSVASECVSLKSNMGQRVESSKWTENQTTYREQSGCQVFACITANAVGFSLG